ncbi:hypothetical protein [Jannaschia faecimaris]|uniref:hypothetical protein n=1 Tax=Jannaschia faecimaris TaxID=1244108 RepID=UPI00147C3EC2|nr:hypothetical protein [Jannaschia faecimaris]
MPFDRANLMLVRQALPVLVLMNLAPVFLVGTLLNRERRQFEREKTLTRNTDFTLGNRLMGRGALDWSLTQAAATGSLRDGASIVVVPIRFLGALARLLGNDDDHHAIKILHNRLAFIMPVGGVVGWARTDSVRFVRDSLARPCNKVGAVHSARPSDGLGWIGRCGCPRASSSGMAAISSRRLTSCGTQISARDDVQGPWF